jgi:class 3 adenylate cyclase
MGTNMGWNEKEAKQRVDGHDFNDFEVNVQDLAKSMDFANLGTKDVRRADAAHLYVDVPNFHLSVRDASADKAKQKKLLRAASVLRKVQGDLLKATDIVGDDDLGKIQIQAARLHSLCYKPYGDEATRAKHAVAMAITLNTYIYEVLNGVFDDLPRKFQSAAGIAAGKSLVANIGFHGDRERICLGTPANLAAKILGGGNTIRITDEVFAHLPELVQEEFVRVDPIAGVEVYQASGLRWGDHQEIASALNVSWDSDKWKKKTEAYRDELPLDEMEVAWAEVKIDVDALTERNSRRSDAVAIFADLDGFTRYVQEAEEDDTVVSLVRELHMIRHEFHAVLKQDFPGIVLQHQGDRVFAILHEPCGENQSEKEKRCRRALDAAIGLQSSMHHVLRPKLPQRKSLHVAIGLDIGTAIVTRLGKKGKREVVCLGPEVIEAEKLQLKSSAKQVRISQTIYDAIQDATLKEEFQKDGAAYVATGLTFPKLEEKQAECAAKAGQLGAQTVNGRVVTLTGAPRQTRPWSR